MEVVLERGLGRHDLKLRHSIQEVPPVHELLARIQGLREKPGQKKKGQKNGQEKRNVNKGANEKL